MKKEQEIISLTVVGIERFLRKSSTGRWKWMSLDFEVVNDYVLSNTELGLYLRLIALCGKRLTLNRERDPSFEPIMNGDATNYVLTCDIHATYFGQRCNNTRLMSTFKSLELKGFIYSISINKSKSINKSSRNSYLVDESKQGMNEGKEEEKKLNKEKKKEEYSELDSPHKKEAEEVVEYLNLKCGKKFRNTPGSLKHIKARLKDGFSVDDCKQVIDKKHSDWSSDPKMAEYLRPETLFSSSKFDGYLNAGLSTAIDKDKELFDFLEACKRGEYNDDV